jgi:lysophospholipase L1-like esterase
MRPVAIGLALVVLAVGVLAVSCVRRAGRKAAIAALGDSITAGYGTEGYPEHLARWRKMPVDNFGRSGDTTEDMRRRLRTVLAGPSEIVLVMGGTNDIGRGWPTERTMANLAAIVGDVRAAGRQPVLICPPPAAALPEPAQRSLRQAIRGYATREGVPAVDPWDALVDRTRPGAMRPELALDGLHPNAEGQRVLAREIARGLGWAVPAEMPAAR